MKSKISKTQKPLFIIVFGSTFKKKREGAAKTCDLLDYTQSGGVMKPGVEIRRWEPGKVKRGENERKKRTFLHK